LTGVGSDGCGVEVVEGGRVIRAGHSDRRRRDGFRASGNVGVQEVDGIRDALVTRALPLPGSRRMAVEVLLREDLEGAEVDIRIV